VLAGLVHGTRTAARCIAVEDELAAVVEWLAETRLALGQPAAATALLRQHLGRHPLRERGYLLSMRAHSDAGRIAEALATYETARVTLAEELAVEPGADLRRLHRELLDTERPPPTPLARSWLPRAVTDFTGRTAVVERLTTTPGCDNVWVIDGMAGIGKTTLAVHVAEATAAQFPDAQLFLDLRGHDEGEPVGPAAALATLLRQMGVPNGRVPPDLDGRSALWRGELAARRCVVVLDNAGSTAQITPLLPAGPGSLVLVTSRRRLLGAAGLRIESLPLLDPGEATDLLSRVAGADRIAAEPTAAGELARLCGYLPLALRLAGARLAHRPTWRVGDLVRRLTTESTVLSELAAEDRTVAAVFSTSYDRLTPATRRTFRLLGLPASIDFTAPAVAALAGCALGDAQHALDELVDHHLLEEPEADRYRLHDLLRLYARNLVVRDSQADPERALTELHDHYLSTAVAAGLRVGSQFVLKHLADHQPRRPDLVPNGVGLEWVGAERPNLVGAVRQAAEQGMHGYAWKLALVLWRYFYERGQQEEILETQAQALAACEKAGDLTGAIVAHNYLASAYHMFGRLDRAREHVNSAVALCREVGDELGEYLARGNLATIMLELGRPRGAIEAAGMAGSPHLRPERSVLSQMTNDAAAYVVLGDLPHALRLYRRVLFGARCIGDETQTLRALAHVGKARSMLGHTNPALRLLRAAIAGKIRLNNPYGVNEAHNDLARVYRTMGRLTEAERHHRIALDRPVGVGNAYLRAETLIDLGTTLHAAGDSEAATHYAAALESATSAGYAYLKGRALVGLADCTRDAQPDAARRYLERALAIFTTMDIPARHEVARQLDELRERPLAAS
jgi:tetratricopeptide (TPR) repeat protein